MPRMLVTGGAGFIGSHIVESALDRGWTVRVADSFRPDVHADEMFRVPAQAGLEVVTADVADRTVIDGLLSDVDVVCHQAAKVGLGVDFDDAPDYVMSNEGATAVLLAAMARASIDRLVLASSMVVYGEGRYRDDEGDVDVRPRRREDLDAGRFDPLTRTGAPLEPLLIDEGARLDPRNVYAVTKAAQENLVTAWTRATGGRAAMLRYHNVYGPHMPMGTPYAGVASLFRSALERGESPRVFEDGRQRRDFIHVRDVAMANIAATAWVDDQAPGTARAFNVGSGEVRTIGEMAEALSAAFGGPSPVITGEYRLGDVRHITASSARLRTETGWTAGVSFAEGMREFAVAPLRAPARIER